MFSHTLERKKKIHPSSMILIFWVCDHINAVPRKSIIPAEICPFSPTTRDERSLRNTRSFRESAGWGYIWRIIFLFHICFLTRGRPQRERFVMRVTYREWGPLCSRRFEPRTSSFNIRDTFYSWCCLTAAPVLWACLPTITLYYCDQATKYQPSMYRCTRPRE